MRLAGLRDKLLGQAKTLVNQGLTPIAIDFGTGCLKVLQLNRGEGGCSLVAAAALPTPEELVADPAKRLAFQAEALPKLLKSGGFKGKRGVCAIPGSLSFCKHMKIAKGEGLPVQAVVEAALAQQHGCHPSQMVFRCLEVADVPKPGGGTQTEVICLAATRDLVERLMGALSDAKLEPVGMHSEPLALLRSFEPISRRAEDKNAVTVVLDIGAGATNMIIAHGTSLVFAKRIDLGGRHLDETICRQTKCTLEEARAQRAAMDAVAAGPAPARVAAPGERTRAMLTPSGTLAVSGTVGAALVEAGDLMRRASSAGTTEAPERRHEESAVFSAELGQQEPREFTPPQADLGEALEHMTDDVGLALRYYASLFPSRPVERAVFVGGEARYRGMCQHIAKSIRVSAQIADPLAAVARTGREPTPGVDFRQPLPGWAVPLGLCLMPTDL